MLKHHHLLDPRQTKVTNIVVNPADGSYTAKVTYKGRRYTIHWFEDGTSNIFND